MPRPTSRRTLLLCTALLALACAGAGSGTVHAKDTPMARFLVSFEGERTVGWDEPRWSPRYDCQHRYWTESSGSERWQVKAKPQKALLWRTSYGAVNVEAGTWSPYDISDQYAFEGSGFVERDRHDRSGFDANDRCGPATSQVNPPLPDDCGNRLPRHNVTLRVSGGIVAVDVIDVYDRNAPAGFRSCALILPPDVASDWPERITGRVRVRDLFDPRRRTITVTGRRSWSHVNELWDGKGRRTERAAVSWRLTLERVADGRTPAKRRPARRRGRR